VWPFDCAFDGASLTALRLKASPAAFDGQAVMRGLDPRIHLLRKSSLQRLMDCRVKPGNDLELTWPSNGNGPEVHGYASVFWRKACSGGSSRGSSFRLYFTAHLPELINKFSQHATQVKRRPAAVFVRRPL
jgi:hypothetical protein